MRAPFRSLAGVATIVLALLLHSHGVERALAAEGQGQGIVKAPDRADAAGTTSIWPPLRARKGLWLVRESSLQVAGIKSPDGRVWGESTSGRVSRVCYGTRDTRDWWVSQVR
jgi:hypothetical protein